MKNKKDFFKIVCEDRKECKSSNLEAVKIENTLVIYNYSTPIAFINIASGYVTMTSQKFSVTTSKNQNYLRCYALSYDEFDPKEYLSLLKIFAGNIFTGRLSS